MAVTDRDTDDDEVGLPPEAVGCLPPEADRALRLTRWGMWWEAVARGFWPAFVWAAAGLAALALGADAALPEGWPGPVVIGWLVVLAMMLAVGLWRLRRPRAVAAQARVDATLPGRPLTALGDALAIGAGDGGAQALWRAHLGQMLDTARRARPVSPKPGLARRDPLALRLVALTALAMALLFGANPLGQGIGAVASTFRGPQPRDLPAAGPGWEGWAAPPEYTRRPVVYLNGLPAGETLRLPEGSRLSLRLYGEGASVAQDVGQPGEGSTPEAPVFVAERSGNLTVAGRRFPIEVQPDDGPTIAPGAAPERRADGRLIQSFKASDDNGVTRAQATITLDLAAIDRRYGLTIDPDPRDPVVIDLPLPARGARTEVKGNLVTDLSQHPWANLPVTISLHAVDGIGQEGTAAPMTMVLPGRRFFDPVAAALIEVRRDLLWSRGNAGMEAELLRAATWQPQDAMDAKLVTTLKAAIGTLEGDDFTPEARDKLAKTLWDAAVQLEDGGLADALAAMQRAQERLSEAIRNGASPDEIRRLMEELKQATADYTRMLAEQGKEDPNEKFVKNQPRQQITGDQIQQMMDEIERLMNEGRMAEAQELLEQFNRMMQNLQVTQGGSGGEGDPMSGPGSPSGRLAETLRQQQRLADEGMRQLQDEFMGQLGEGQPGQGQGQPGQGMGQGQGQGQGQPGQGTGQGQSGSGQPGSGQPGSGQSGAGQAGSGGPGSLADQQRALRDELARQRALLPGPGSAEGDAARRELDRAGQAMDDAEQALRDGDIGGAMDRQAEAIEAMREGLRELGRMAEGQSGQPGQEQAQGGGDGQQQGGLAPGEGDPTRALPYLPRPQLDPLGRESGGGNGGVEGTGDDLAGGDGRGSAAARAQQLLDEIRRRTGQSQRPTDERDYLRRLLDQF